VNEQAVKLMRWLLAGNGALKNLAQLLTDAFGPLGVVAATIDASTITAYPVDPTAEPQGQEWTSAAQQWAHPLHSQLLPRSTSAHHHVVVGLTSRNEVLVLNLAAADYLGIEADNPVPMMRSWLMQTLSKTPAAVAAVTDAALTIPGAERLVQVDDPTSPPRDASLVLTTRHTSTPIAGQPHPIIVSSQAAGAANVVLCNEAVAGIYLANRYWPIWRRMEIADQQWEHLKAALTPAAPVAAAVPPQPLDEHEHPPAEGQLDERRPTPNGPNDASTSANSTSPPTAAAAEPDPQPTSADPATCANDTSPASASAEESTQTFREPLHLAPVASPQPPALHRDLTAALTSGNDTSLASEPVIEPANPRPPLAPDTLTPSAPADNDTADHTPALPGRPAAQPADEPGLYILGPVYALGLDPDTKEPVKHSAVTRQGVRKPVKALMALATSNGVTPSEWEGKILQVTPQNRRQLRTQIRKMMGGKDPIRNDARGLLVVDMFCDWKEFNSLIGHTPESATTEALTAAVQLIRGAPFEDVPDQDYSWRSVQLLKDELIDRCSAAAVELAQRHQAAGAYEAAYQTARLGLRVYAQREDLWVVAVNSVTDTDRKALIWDLKHAIPVPTHPDLRRLLAASRAS
jgi:hypothetical protein